MAQATMAKQAIAPHHLPVEDEDDEGDSVGHGCRHNFECIDFVQILIAEEGEQRDDQESGAGAEVADVKADGDGAKEDG